jgi:hypothetical protein
MRSIDLPAFAGKLKSSAMPPVWHVPALNLLKNFRTLERRLSQRRDIWVLVGFHLKMNPMIVKAPRAPAARANAEPEAGFDMSYQLGTIARSMPLKKIVSGGQTGVDRGALDAALGADFSCGGWMPGDRMAEDGVIAERYPLTPLPNGNNRQRTRLNVVDSDGTAVLYDGHLSGGTRLTHDLCGLVNRPCILISARETPDPIAAVKAVLKFIEDNRIETLNVAGPRASRWAGGYRFATDVVSGVIFRLAGACLGANT